MPVTEAPFTLPTADGATIYGTKSTAPGNTKAIFIVHGRTSTMGDYIFKRAADAFPEEGYDVFRFNLYDGEEGARSMVDCTLQTHADDLNTVLKAFAKSYQKTFLTGHSYGGPTVMLANPPGITAASLWDPSFDYAAAMHAFPKNSQKIGKYYADTWGVTVLVGEEMHRQDEKMDEAWCINLSKNFNAPVQVVFAGEGYYVKRPLSFHSFGHPQNRSDVVKGASHCFDNGQTCDELLRLTQQWFAQW
ncbi:MAG: hypothetical protein GC129_03405 [Proteobacteria bacterium]|nr:hypothetical protein [Pseudomonadota bacterium]